MFDNIQIQEKLNYVSNLEDNWNSYGAEAPNTLAADNCTKFLELSLKIQLNPHRIEPSAMNGIGVTYKNNSKKVYVEFYNKGNAHMLLCDENLNLDTKKVENYEQIIREIKEFLQ